jgi:hypothetical protein
MATGATAALIEAAKVSVRRFRPREADSPMPLTTESPTGAAIQAMTTDVDVQTALALTRAVTRTLMALSSEAQQEMASALRDEIALQQAQGGQVPHLVAALLEDHLRDAA